LSGVCARHANLASLAETKPELKPV
jgi:hypothetical protein